MSYYDGTKLLSLSDKNKKKPEIYLSVTNRTAGKTTYFTRLLINRWLKRKQQFGVLIRFAVDLKIMCNYFDDVVGMFFPNIKILGHVISNKYIEFRHYINDTYEICGFGLVLNDPDFVKRHSKIFNKIEHIFFDEFQSETDRYVNDEIDSWISIHTSIARGQGKQSRYVPYYMASNPISIFNPYYNALGITSKLNKLNYIQGDGWVLEHQLYETAATANQSSIFNQSVSNKQTQYLMSFQYLNDDDNYVQSIPGVSEYITTIVYNKKKYAIRYFPDQTIIFVSANIDPTAPILTKNKLDYEHQIAFVTPNNIILRRLKKFFETGAVIFQSAPAKTAFLSLL